MSVAITGNTYPVKEQLKALGGHWNAERKAWMVPEAKVEEARRIVANVPKKSARGKSANDNIRSVYRRKYGWDGVVGSPSYYSSGLYDEES